MRLIMSALAALSVVLFASAAQAKLCFGTDERLVFIQKLDIKSPEDKPLNLARLLRVACILLPYAVSDAGYVLATENQDNYYALTDDEIARFQSTRGLPKPMPPYEMGMVDWVMGHLLWAAIPLIAIGVLMPWDRVLPWRRRRKPRLVQ